MNQRIVSIAAYVGSVTVATLAAALMSGNALAEGPLDDSRAPFVSVRSSAEVKAELAAGRSHISSFATEYALQQPDTGFLPSGYTRAEATAGYISAREQVHAMTSEDGGSAYLGRSGRMMAGSMLASSQR